MKYPHPMATIAFATTSKAWFQTSRPPATLCPFRKSSTLKPSITASSTKTPTSKPALTHLREVAERTNISTSQTDQLIKLASMLQEATKHVNLTAIRTHDAILFKHIIDALTLLPLLDQESPSSIIDVGTGAGFPGLVLAIARPAWHLTLLDAARKKTAFHAHVVDAFDLKNVSSMWARAEEAGQLPSYRQSFCVAVARSVAKMPVLAELTLPLVRLDGCVVAQKSLQADFSEVAAAEGGIKRCGGVLESIMPAWPEQWTAQGHMPEASISTDDRDKSLVVLRKISNTPAKYPRPPGMPKKSPL